MSSLISQLFSESSSYGITLIPLEPATVPYKVNPGLGRRIKSPGPQRAEMAKSKAPEQPEAIIIS